MKLYKWLGNEQETDTLKDKGWFVLTSGSDAAAINEQEVPAGDQIESYEVLDQKGKLEDGAFAVFNNIPVTEEGRELFESRFQNRAGLVEKEPGFAAIRILRPLDSDTYVVLTEWESPAFYEKWKESQAFAKAHSEKPQEGAEKPRANIFSGSSYVTMYKAKPEEDE